MVVQDPRTSTPVLATGAGDNFNAGVCNALLYQLPTEDTLLSGVGTSGYLYLDYVQFLNSSAERDKIRRNEFLREGSQYPSFEIHYAGFCLSQHLRPKIVQSRVYAKSPTIRELASFLKTWENHPEELMHD